MTASYLCLLPRLIPAPQALIRPNRRLALSGVNAIVTGVYQGVVKHRLSYTANQLCPIANLAPFSVRVLCIKHRLDPSNSLRGIKHPPGPSMYLDSYTLGLTRSFNLLQQDSALLLVVELLYSWLQLFLLTAKCSLLVCCGHAVFNSLGISSVPDRRHNS